MTRALWRIAVEARAYGADDLSGRGAERSGGRWNPEGWPAVYTSETRALACLETVVHLNAGGLPFNRFLVRIDVPDALWDAADRSVIERPPVGWDAEPYGRASLDAGAIWLATGAAALLIVPSVIVPEERNVLINPRHADSARLRAVKVRRWSYDPRLGR